MANDVTPPPAIIVLGPGALRTAQRVRACLPGATVHGLSKRLASSNGVDRLFDDLTAHLRQCYASGTPIVGLCAAGILIRCLAPDIGARIDVSAKTVEPPVLALAEDGSAVVPLLGGLAGVNTMARRIAEALAVAPAITTSGELRFGQCLLDPPPGYQLADLEHGKRFVSDLLAGQRARIDGDAPWLQCSPQLPLTDDADRVIRVSIERQASPDTLLIHPKAVIVALSDPQRDLPTAPGALADDIATALERHGIATGALAALLLDARFIGDARVAEACRALGVPARFIAVDANAIDTTEAAEAADTAEAANAKSVAGTRAPDAAGLIDAVRRSTPGLRPLFRSTYIAIAATTQPLTVDTIGIDGHVGDSANAIDDHVHATVDTIGTDGRGQANASADRSVSSLGHLTVVGIGPGSKALLAPAASEALSRADDILGYATYTQMAGPFRPNQRVHDSHSDNREELQRARDAFALAATGRRVVVVSSGDPGVFAMAAAVVEALEQAMSESGQDAQHAALAAAWSDVQLSIVPGISAAMAAAAVAGAPLGHDFCMMSLSDNLKPWSVIEQRLQLAAQADLALAFYNPISRARPWQLDRALEIVRAVRDPQTPVMLGRNIDRPGASLTTLSLGELRAAQVDMRTMVIVGSSTTRRFTTSRGREWVYTPRWYPNAGANPLTPPIPTSQE